MPGGTAEERVIDGEQEFRLQGFGGGEMECVKVLETEVVQLDAALLDGGREGLE